MLSQLVTRYWVCGQGGLVMLAGEIDLSTTDQMRTAIQSALGPSGATKVVVDAAGVEFIDAAAVGALLACCRSARRRGKRVLLSNPSQAVRRILHLTDLWDEFDFPEREGSRW